MKSYLLNCLINVITYALQILGGGGAHAPHAPSKSATGYNIDNHTLINKQAK